MMTLIERIIRVIKTKRAPQIMIGLMVLQVLAILIFGRAAVPFFWILAAAFWATVILDLSGLLD